MSHFETYYMLRKALLILISADVFTDAPAHSFASVLINGFFLFLVWCFKPVIHFPSSTFPGYNLFLISELAGAAATLLGNVFALIGSTSDDNQGMKDVLGVFFAVLNVTFATFFFTLFQVDRKRSAAEVRSEGLGGALANSAALSNVINNSFFATRFARRCAFSSSRSLPAPLTRTLARASLTLWLSGTRSWSRSRGPAKRARTRSPMP